MSPPSGMAAKYGATPGKLILIGVLAVVLLGVVYWNYLRSPTSAVDAPPELASDSKESATEPPSPRGDRRQRATASTGERRSLKPGGRDDPWPEVELSAVLAHDPFALPSKFPQPIEVVADADPAVEVIPVTAEEAEKSAQQRAATLSAIRQRGVQLVLRNGTEYVAKIGDRQLRVGDTIEGFRVIDINLSGVVLEGDSSQ